MSARMPRWEIVRTDAGFHARFRASNGRVIVSSEVYGRRTAAAHAIKVVAREFGVPWVRLTTEVRDIDEREVTP